MGEKVDETKGRTKKAVGELTGNDSLKDRGRVDRGSAKVKRGVGNVADKVKDAQRKATR